MNIEVSWDNDEKTIIRFAYGNNWTWEDYRAASETSRQMMRSVDQTVDLIADYSNGSPPPLDALMKYRRAMATLPENSGLVVIVGGSYFINTLVSIFSGVYRSLGEALVIANSVEEARSIIAERREKTK